MSNKLIYLFIILILVIISSQIFTAANESNRDAVVTNLQGTVEVKIGATWKAIKIGDKIFPKQVIRTGDNSFVDLTLADQTSIRVDQNTQMVINKLLRKDIGKKGFFKKKKIQVKNIDLKLFKGGILSKVKQLKKTSTFNLATPAAVCGIRGTEFSVEHEKKITNVDVIEGIVEVYNIKYPERKILVKAGKTTFVELNKTPEKPTPITSEQRQRLIEILKQISYEDEVDPSQRKIMRIKDTQESEDKKQESYESESVSGTKKTSTKGSIKVEVK